MQRTLLALSLAAALTLALAPKAEAQDIGGVGDIVGVILIGGGIVTATYAGFAIADTVSFAGGTPFDVGLSVTDLVMGTLAIAGGVTALTFASLAGNNAEEFTIGGIALALGSYQLSHGIWSLLSGRSGADAPTIGVAPSATGAILTLGGTF